MSRRAARPAAKAPLREAGAALELELERGLEVPRLLPSHPRAYRKALRAPRLVPELRAARTDGELLTATVALAPSIRTLYLSTARGFDACCVETRRTRRALAGRARVKLDQVAPKRP